MLEARPQVILLDAGPLPAANQSLLQPAYQHLYQEHGLVGHVHAAINATTAEASGVCVACFERLASGAAAAGAGEAPVLPALRLGFTAMARTLQQRAAVTARKGGAAAAEAAASVRTAAR